MKSKNNSKLPAGEKTVDELFSESLREEAERSAKPTILICGYTGAGKTSMIKALLGDLVPDDAIGHGRPMTSNFDFYRNDCLSIYDSRGLEPGQTEESFVNGVQNFVKECRNSKDVKNHVHLVWYCIQGAGARVTDADKRLIREVFNNNVLVLVTKNDITNDKQRSAIREQLLESGVPEKNIVFCSEKDKASQKAVIETSYEMMPEAYRDAFIAGQIANLDMKGAKADTIINSAAIAAGAIGGGNPFPVSDSIMIAPVQVSMIAALAYLYGFRKEDATLFLGPALAKAAGLMTASSLAKLIPVWGQVQQAVVATAITKGLGYLTKMYLVDSCKARISGEPAPTFTFDPKFLKDVLSQKKAA